MVTAVISSDINQLVTLHQRRLKHRIKFSFHIVFLVSICFMKLRMQRNAGETSRKMVKHQFCLSLTKHSSLYCSKKRVKLQDKVNIFASIASLALPNPSRSSLNVEWEKRLPSKVDGASWKKNAISDKIVRRSWYSQWKAAHEDFTLHLPNLFLVSTTAIAWMRAKYLQTLHSNCKHILWMCYVNDWAKSLNDFTLHSPNTDDGRLEYDQKFIRMNWFFPRFSVWTHSLVSLNISHTHVVFHYAGSDYKNRNIEYLICLNRDNRLTPNAKRIEFINLNYWNGNIPPL